MLMQRMTASEVDGAGKALLGERWLKPDGDKSPAWTRKVAAFNRILAESKHSNDPQVHRLLGEAMHQDDFPNIMGDTLGRLLNERYTAYDTPDWRLTSAIRTAPDYRDLKTFDNHSINAVLTKVGPHGGSTEARAKDDDTATTYAVEDYDAKSVINRQAIINDDLGYLTSIPDELAEAARMTEMQSWTATHWTTTGPNNLTSLTSNPVLDVAGLKAAFTQIMTVQDPDSSVPIMVDAPVLEVCPGLAIAAQEVIKATSIEVRTASGSAGRNFITDNWIDDFIGALIINRWSPTITTSNDDTSWCLFARPRLGRSCFETAFLRGREAPRLYVKAPNKLSIGGGLAPINEGDFDNNNIEYKVEHAFVHKIVDTRYGYGSTGAGS